MGPNNYSSNIISFSTVLLNKLLDSSRRNGTYYTSLFGTKSPLADSLSPFYQKLKDITGTRNPKSKMLDEADCVNVIISKLNWIIRFILEGRELELYQILDEMSGESSNNQKIIDASKELKELIHNNNLNEQEIRKYLDQQLKNLLKLLDAAIVKNELSQWTQISYQQMQLEIVFYSDTAKIQKNYYTESINELNNILDDISDPHMRDEVNTTLNFLHNEIHKGFEELEALENNCYNSDGTINISSHAEYVQKAQIHQEKCNKANNLISNIATQIKDSNPLASEKLLKIKTKMEIDLKVKANEFKVCNQALQDQKDSLNKGGIAKNLDALVHDLLLSGNEFSAFRQEISNNCDILQTSNNLEEIQHANQNIISAIETFKTEHENHPWINKEEFKKVIKKLDDVTEELTKTASPCVISRISKKSDIEDILASSKIPDSSNTMKQHSQRPDYPIANQQDTNENMFLKQKKLMQNIKHKNGSASTIKQDETNEQQTLSPIVLNKIQKLHELITEIVSDPLVFDIDKSQLSKWVVTLQLIGNINDQSPEQTYINLQEIDSLISNQEENYFLEDTFDTLDNINSEVNFRLGPQ